MKQTLKMLCIALSLVVFLLPGYMYFVVNKGGEQLLSSGSLSGGLLTLFRLFGLYTFVLVWSQLMLGALRIPLQRLFGSRILKLHLFFGPFTLLLALTHYAFFVVANLLNGLNPIQGISSYLGPEAYHGYIGVAAFYLMVLTVITALLRTKTRIQKYWRQIHYINYLIFVLGFLHSFEIGSDVQNLPMKALYVFFTVSFIIALLYKRLIPFFRPLFQST